MQLPELAQAEIDRLESLSATSLLSSLMGTKAGKLDAALAKDPLNAESRRLRETAVQEAEHEKTYRKGLEFFALTFALFKAGAIPVLVDPGMGVHNLKECLTEAKPAAFVGVTKAQRHL